MMVKKTEKDEFQRLLDYYKYTLHELPAGVLYGANGASLKECADLMKGTYELEELAVIVGNDISEFLSVCRWHYERYAHYLGRQRHFGSYPAYLEKHSPPNYSPTINSTRTR